MLACGYQWLKSEVIPAEFLSEVKCQAINIELQLYLYTLYYGCSTAEDSSGISILEVLTCPTAIFDSVWLVAANRLHTNMCGMYMSVMMSSFSSFKTKYCHHDYEQ